MPTGGNSSMRRAGGRLIHGTSNSLAAFLASRLDVCPAVRTSSGSAEAASAPFWVRPTRTSIRRPRGGGGRSLLCRYLAARRVHLQIDRLAKLWLAYGGNDRVRVVMLCET